ncbi:hypothetical protein OH76DRAFT_1478618 [Lentinus brumalis]|uniref:Uncharacterized protein n=1 Tax=Lentinus brumalis TaxID=2498619 RepID=A0A371DRJ9_9APHY|nr:hypothetical protein OH76DRAFT_1478618 [Polyporus brumalis]
MPDLAECRKPDLGTPLETDEPGTPHSQQVDYEALDFKWEKFDRGDIVLDAPSSPLPPADSYSEEVFWSQPRAPEPHTPIRTDSFDPPDAALESSPASLRLSGISTPDMQSPQIQRHADAHIHTPSRRYHATHDSRYTQTDRRLRSVATPRMTAPSTQAELSEQDPWAEDVRQHLMGVQPQDGQRSRSYDDGVDEEEAEPRSDTPPAASFAPAPGIYISPLRGPADVDGEGEGGVEGLGSHPKDRVAQRAVYANTRSSNPSLKPSAIVHDQPASEEEISQSTSQSGEHAAGCGSWADEIEEDELARSSQESKDTIESWSD